MHRRRRREADASFHDVRAALPSNDDICADILTPTMLSGVPWRWCRHCHARRQTGERCRPLFRQPKAANAFRRRRRAAREKGKRLAAAFYIDARVFATRQRRGASENISTAPAADAPANNAGAFLSKRRFSIAASTYMLAFHADDDGHFYARRQIAAADAGE